MMPAEARWFEQRIRELPSERLYPMLNVGSQTEEFRRRQQPWISRHIFDPIARSGGQVIHSDIQAAPGIDLVGDLADPVFRQRAAALNPRSVFCSNLLEHVADPRAFSAALLAVLPPGAYLFVSVPFRMPYHPDPIDTRFRPTTTELAAFFPNTTVCSQATLRCGTLAQYAAERFFSDPAFMLSSLLAKHAPSPGAQDSSKPLPLPPPLSRSSGVREEGRGEAQDIPSPRVRGEGQGGGVPWLFKTLMMTCLVLRKEDGGGR